MKKITRIKCCWDCPCFRWQDPEDHGYSCSEINELHNKTILFSFDWQKSIDTAQLGIHKECPLEDDK